MSSRYLCGLLVLVAAIRFPVAERHRHDPGAAGARQQSTAIELCLAGEFDLGVRLQGLQPAAGEPTATTWCVVTEDRTDRVHFRGSGNSNPDMTGTFVLTYLPPDLVRIVNADAPPDVDFAGAAIGVEAARYRRIDPRRLLEELSEHPEWVASASEDAWQTVRYPGNAVDVRIRVEEDRLVELHTRVDLPLRGTVPVSWSWDWATAEKPDLVVSLDGEPVFRATATWRSLTEAEAEPLWEPTGGQEPVQAPGDAWPARVDMQLERLDEDVYLVRGVRTGFHHLVIDTAAGLVIGDAPAGWVEMQQIPPADMVPGLGISGLSEQLIEFLEEQLPGRPIRAVALTHAHDDHAGGARAFAAADAEVYAPADVSEFLSAALNDPDMPPDRMSAAEGTLNVLPVIDRVELPDGSGEVVLISIGPGPHVSASLGLWSVNQGYFFQSDLHVPNSESDAPRTERAVTECWFAEWAVEHLPPETIVLSSHGLIRSPVSRLARYLESAECH